jgi:hypothetical protein
VWPDSEPLINAIIPEEYLAQLELKKNQLQSLINNLEVIKEKDPALHDVLQAQIKAKVVAWAEENGAMDEVQWLVRVATHCNPPTADTEEQAE